MLWVDQVLYNSRIRRTTSHGGDGSPWRSDEAYRLLQRYSHEVGLMRVTRSFVVTPFSVQSI